MGHKGSIPNPVENLTGSTNIGLGNVPDHSAVFKFGFNDAVGATFVPVCINGIYRTPQVGSATQLRIKAGNAADNPAGLGAQSIILEGLDANGEFLTEVVATNGTSAGVSSVGSFFRLFRAAVVQSGVYATTTVRSHVGEITVENDAGTEDWAVIRLNGHARGQTEVGAYTTPADMSAAIVDVTMSATSNQPVDIMLMVRNNAAQTTPPYSAMRAIGEFAGLETPLVPSFKLPPVPILPLSDFIFFAKTQTSASVSVQFNLLLKRVV
ncbi:MAG: hypothetical protein V7745_07615 [Pseudomonadales bacterium]